MGSPGATGVGSQGATGATGVGTQGATGVGATGATGGIANFFALMPGDNAATVAVGADVEFPQNGPVVGAGIVRSGPSSFTLAAIGTYLVQFQVSVTEAGQLAVALNGVVVANTVAGRATGTSQISQTCLITTSTVNTALSIRNPPGNSTALTITPLAGGASVVSAHLVVSRYA